MREFQYHRHSVGQNSFHFIWTPKYRYKVLKTSCISKVCEGVLRMIAYQCNYTIYELKIMSDHIHMFAEIPPSSSVSDALQRFKGVSSRVLRRNFIWLRKRYPRGGMWSPGNFLEVLDV